MGIKFTDFQLRGFDVSEFNGTIDWNKVTGNFIAIRVGYGNNIDVKFVQNADGAKKKGIDLIAYWYSDYYSNWYNTKHAAYGMTDKAWGIKQADNCYAAMKNYPFKILFLDVENITYAGWPKLSDAIAKEHAQTINRAFIERMEQLGVKCGIYASLGWLSWFYSWFRNKPLWVAFYPYRTAKVSAEDVIYMCSKNGWLVDPLIWQYASDGDADDNGTADGKTFGMQYDFLDLNGWVSSGAEYSNLFWNEDTPNEVIIPPMNTRTIPVKTATRTLTLRKKPQVSILTQIKLLPAGTVFDCLEEVRDTAGNIWQRVGIDQYVADTHNGIQYLK